MWLTWIRLALEKTTAETEEDTAKHESVAEENSRTIRPPTKSPISQVSKLPPEDLSIIDEDYSDLAGDDDDTLAEKVADFKVRRTVIPFSEHTVCVVIRLIPSCCR
jgi:hypothetical protein